MKELIKRVMPKWLYYRCNLIRDYFKSKWSINRIMKYTDKHYYLLNNRHIDWKSPVTYTEKINYSKIFCANDEKTELTDKYLVRNWVEKKIGRDYLIPLLGVYDKFEDIDFDILPSQFVIKCNHDSGSVSFISDINIMTKNDFDKLRAKYDYFIKRNFAYWGFEMHYKNIIPKILVEKYMGDNIYDYKFLCFNGKPYYCWVDFDRFGNHKRNIYDMQWNLQPFNQWTYGNYEDAVKKPDNFEKMIEIVGILCEGFDQVRVDLYDVDSYIYFGEMTFTNGNGMEIITPDKYDYVLGELWKLDTKDKKM